MRTLMATPLQRGNARRVLFITRMSRHPLLGADLNEHYYGSVSQALFTEQDETVVNQINQSDCAPD